MMQAPEPFSYIQNRKTECEERIKQLDRSINLWSLFRLFSFLLSAVLIYFYFKKDQSVFLYSGLLIFPVFLYGVRRHLKEKNTRNHVQMLHRLFGDELRVWQGNYPEIHQGQSTLTRNAYAEDLDLFGPGSLFHFLDHCSTKLGKDRLANRLQHPMRDPIDILNHQQAYQELAASPDFRFEFQAHTMQMEHPERDHRGILEQWTSQEKILKNTSFFTFFTWIWGILSSVGMIYLYAIGQANPATALLVLNLSITGFYARKIIRFHGELSGMQKTLEVYAKAIDEVDGMKFSSPLLREEQEQLHEAAHALRELSSISDMFDRRLNPIVFIVLNGTMLYDFHATLRAQRWLDRYKGKTTKWLDGIAQWEMMISFGNWNHVHPDFCIPQLSEEKIMRATQLSHPLIRKEKRIPNDLSIGKDERLILITGSNMSGKSTWLRSAGLNLILARCGANVCADDFVFFPMHLCTSLRQTDNLRENISLFQAELLKLKGIQDELKKEPWSLVLIDEMLRGTNSEDKLNGSRLLLEKLLHLPCLAMVATHDLALGDMEEQHRGAVSNYCFESRIENNELFFDYTLRKGLARNKNATFLLKKMEII